MSKVGSRTGKDGMDNTAWLRQTLIGAALIGVNGQPSTIVDDPDRLWLLTLDEIVITAQLWAQLGRTPSPTELLPLRVNADHAPYLAPLVRVLRSVPQIRTWVAASAVSTDLFVLDLADAAD